EVELDATAFIREMRERRLAVRAPRHDPPRDAHDVAFALLIRRMQVHGIGGRMRAVESVRERLHAPRHERVELLLPRAADEARFVARAAGPPPAPPRPLPPSEVR